MSKSPTAALKELLEDLLATKISVSLPSTAAPKPYKFSNSAQDCSAVKTARGSSPEVNLRIQGWAWIVLGKRAVVGLDQNRATWTTMQRTMCGGKTEWYVHQIVSFPLLNTALRESLLILFNKLHQVTFKS